MEFSSRLTTRWLFWLVLASSIGQASSQDTVYQRLIENPHLSLFRDVLRLSGLHERSILSDASQKLTLFAPSNEVLSKDEAVLTYLEQPGWSVHLKQLADLHLVFGKALSASELFSEGSSVYNKSLDSLAISTDNQTISGINIVETFATANGIVHVVDGILRNDWKSIRLNEIATSTGSSTFSGLIEVAGFETELQSFMPLGTTLLVTRDDSLDQDKTFLELLNSKSEALAYLLYNTIDVNLYSKLLKPGINLLASPRGGKAQMWVTKDLEGMVRFNNAVANDFGMAENGVLYVLDRALSPPTLIEFLGITATRSEVKVRNTYNLYSSVFWDTADLGRILGYNEAKQFTLFAPIDDFWDELPLDEAERLLNPLWSPHLDDLLNHWLADKSYTREQLRQLAVSTGGEYELLMLSGFTVLVRAEGDNDISVSDGNSTGKLSFSSGGVDGVFHVVDTALLPPSMLFSVFELASADPRLSSMASLLATTTIDNLANDIGPFTFFAPEDQSLATYRILATDATAFIQSHSFRGLLLADKLLEMNGETISSLNDIQFLISVEGGVVTIDSTENDQAKIVATDILGNTGVLHRISRPLMNPGSLQISDLNDATVGPNSDSEIPAETDAPSDSETMGESLIVSDSFIPTETVAPSEELGDATTAFSFSDSPSTVVTIDSMLVGDESDQGSVTPLIATDTPVAVGQFTSSPIAGPTAGPNTKTDSLSVSPTQLVEVVVLKEGSDDAGEGPSSIHPDFSGENEATSATSAECCRHDINRFIRPVTSLLFLKLL